MTGKVLNAIAICILSAFVGVNAFALGADETIRTSTGTFRLSPSDPSQLIGDSALRSARRTTELALAAVAADVAQLQEKQKKLDVDFITFDKSVDALEVDLDKQKKALDSEVAALDARATAFVSETKVYNAQVDDQRAQVAASNALRADQRSPANVSRLNDWGDELDARKAALESKGDALDRAGDDYNRKADKYNEYRKSKTAEMSLANESLMARQKDLTAQLGEAYRQLQLCYTYAQQIDKLLSEKYNVNVSAPTSAMMDAGERLKELSNSGFDGSPSGRSALTESNKGPNTDFFKKQ